MLHTSLVGQLRLNASLFPDRPAIELVGGDSLSYSKAWDRVVSLAHSLRDVAPSNDLRLVAFLLPNSIDASLSYLACQLAGCVAVPLNTRLADSELRFILEHSETKHILSSDALLARADQLGQAMGATVTDVNSIPVRSEGSGALPDVDGAHPMVVGYTSGTTGLPKGGIYSGDHLFLSYCQWARRFKIDEASVVLTPGPLFHLSYAGLTLTALMVGGTARIMSEFTPGSALDEMAAGANWIFLVPTMAKEVLSEAETRGISRLDEVDFILSSGAPIPAELLSRELEFFPNATIGEAYGWSEGGWVTYETKNPKDLIPSCVGRPIVGVDLSVLDDDRRPCGVGQPGEIAVRNMLPFQGYLNHPDKTFEAVWNGYILSGDIGIWTKDGRLLVVDRKKDMIVTGGENVYSAEVERILAEHPEVLEVAVIGRPDTKWGEVVTAVVVPRDESLTDQELRDYCRRHIAGYKVPKRVEFRDALPRNAMGKLQKFKLR